jgi:beta-N-acetylglucosaminidase
VKKWLAFFVLPFVLLFSSLSAHAADDITGHYFEKDMRNLIDLGYLKGGVNKQGQTVYEPDRAVTRAEFAAFLVRVLEKEDLNVVNPKSFSDVKEKDWYYRVVQQAAQMNIISGTPDGKFLPNTPISRESLASMMNGAFEYKGIKLDVASLTFKDTAKIQGWAALSVRRMVDADIIEGYGDQTFRPSDNATRGTTSAFLNRMIDTLKKTSDSTVPEPPKPEEPKPQPKPVFELATVTQSGTTSVKEFDSYEQAKAAATQSNQVVLKDDKIVYMKSGIVSPSQAIFAATLYTSDSFGSFYFNLVAGTETEFIDAGDTWVKAKFNDTTGYFKLSEVTLHPSVQVKGYSFYKVEGGNLWHSIYNVNTQTATSYLYGDSGTLPDGNYKSSDGYTFKSITTGQTYELYQYFDVMPLYTKTSYTAEQLNDYIVKNKPVYYGPSPLETMGEALKNVEAKYNVNAMYLLAHAIHESNWGTSKLALEKKNLFGIKAYDGTAYVSAGSFPTYEACLEELAKEYLLKPGTGYLLDSGIGRANGEVIGHKELGMNVRYASDPYWGQKIAGHMLRIDNYLGGKERNAYKIAVTLTDNVNVRSDATALTANKIYTIPKAGTPVLVLNEVSPANEGTWFEIAPKNLNGANYPKAYVYSYGASYGTNMKVLNLAK